MTTDTCSRKPLWIACIALMVLTVVVASDGSTKNSGGNCRLVRVMA